MPYARWKQDHLHAMASPVAPPVHPEVTEPGLRAMAGAHLSIGDGETVASWISGLDAASPDEIELGRVLLRHALVEMAAHVDGVASSHPLISQEGDALDAVGDAIRVIAGDAYALVSAAQGRPRDGDARALAVSAVTAVAEACAFARALADSPDAGVRERELAERAEGLADGALHNLEGLRGTVATVDPAAAASIPSDANISAGAFLDVRSAPAKAMKVPTPAEVSRLVSTCGPRDTLWLAAQPSQRERAKESGGYFPMGTLRAHGLRNSVRDALAAFHGTFHADGFVAFLRQGAAAARWGGLERIGREPSEAETLSRVPEFSSHAIARRREAERGHRMLSTSRGIEALVAQALGEPPRPRLTVRSLPGGGCVGMVDGGSDTFVIVPDPVEGHPAAVLAARIPAEELRDGVPEADGLRDGLATNFENEDLALASLHVGDSPLTRLADGQEVDVIDERHVEFEPPSSSPTP